MQKFAKLFWNGQFIWEKSQNQNQIGENNLEIPEKSFLELTFVENLSQNKSENSLNLIQKTNSQLFLKIPIWSKKPPKNNDCKVQNTQNLEKKNLDEILKMEESSLIKEKLETQFEKSNKNHKTLEINNSANSKPSKNLENLKKSKILGNWQTANLESVKARENWQKILENEKNAENYKEKNPIPLKTKNLDKLNLKKLENQTIENSKKPLEININIWQVGQNCSTEIVLFGKIETKTQIKIIVWQMSKSGKVQINSDFLVVSFLEIEARIIIKALDCEAEFTSHNLMLEQKAEVKVLPILEIYQAPKKCTHGATISTFDPNSLEYLETRGISPKSAKKLIIKHFLEKIK